MTQVTTPPTTPKYNYQPQPNEQPIAVIQTLNTKLLMAAMEQFFTHQNDAIDQISTEYTVDKNDVLQMISLHGWQQSNAMQENLSSSIAIQLQNLGIPPAVQAEIMSNSNFTMIINQLTQKINHSYQEFTGFSTEMIDSSQIDPNTNRIIAPNGVPNPQIDAVNTSAQFMDSLVAFANGNGNLDLNDLLSAPELDFSQLAHNDTSIEILNLLVQRLTIQLATRVNKANELDASQEQSRIRADNERALQQLKTAQEKQKEANSSTSGGKIAGYVVCALGLLASAIITAVSLGTATAVAATIAVVSFAVTIAFTAASMSGGIDKAVEAAAKSVAGDDPAKLSEAKQGFAAMFAVLQVLIAIILALASFGANVGPAINAVAKTAADSAKEVGKSVSAEVAKAVAKEIAAQVKSAITRSITLGLKGGATQIGEAAGRSISTAGQIAANAANLGAAGLTIGQVGTSLFSTTKSFQAAKLQQQATEATADKEQTDASAEAGREIIKVLLDLIAQINQAMNEQIDNISDVLETRKQATDNIDQQFSIA